MEPVGELHQKHADVVGDGEDELLQVLALLGSAARPGDLGELRHPIDERGHLSAEALAQVVEADARVLHGVVEDRGDDGVDIEMEVGEQPGHGEGMGDVGRAGVAGLAGVGGAGERIGLADRLKVRVPVVAGDASDQRAEGGFITEGGRVGRSWRAP